MTLQHQQDTAPNGNTANSDFHPKTSSGFDTIFISPSEAPVKRGKFTDKKSPVDITKNMQTLMHDLKNPLSIIYGSASLLKQQPDMPDDHRNEAVDSILESVQDMRRLISSWLNVSKLEAGQKLTLQSVSFFDFIRRCVDSFDMLAESQELTLIFDTVGDDVMIECDHDRMIQAINNLISNAIKYTPSGGKIMVKAYARSSHVMLYVADTGIGISEETLPHIFDRFYRASSVTKRGIDGTGLGLAICKAIVDRHHGHINVSSRMGLGTKFTVMLPHQQPDE